VIAIVAWFVGIGLHGIAMLYIVRELRWKFRFRAWQEAWGSLLIATAFIGLRRILAFFHVTIGIDWLSAIDAIFVSFFLAVGFRKLSRIFHQELPTFTTPTAKIVIDSNSVILEWCVNATALFGFTSAEAIGKTLMQTIMPSRDWEAHRAAIEKFLTSGEPGRVLYRTFATNACCKDGQEIAVEITVVSEFITHGDVRFHGIISRLVTI